MDGRNLALSRGTGVAGYAAALAAGLPRIGCEAAVLLDAPQADNRAGRWLRAAWPGACRAVRVDMPPAGFAAAWQARDAFRMAQVHFDVHGRLLRLRSQTRPAVMHWTYPLPMKFDESVNIYTIHDLIPLCNTKLTDIDSARFGRIARQVVRAADHIVTVSEASRRDIIALLGVAPSAVTNTYQPVRLPLALRAAPPPLRRGHFLFCGSIEPRKNLGRLIQAHRASHSRRPLILAGPDGWQAARELEAGGVEIRPLASMPADAVGGVWRAPWLERAALLELLRGARALLFPSLAEGFGLPIIEAMALGVPVMTSTGGATGEIAGAAALLVDPYNGNDMAACIAALDHDDTLCARLAATGTRHAELYSEAACFTRLAAVYATIGARPAP